MGFTMRAFVVVNSLLFALFLFPSSVFAQSFSIDSAIVKKVGNGYKLDASLSYTLTPRVIEALENGVPITFYQTFELTEPMAVIGSYLDWRSTLWQTKLRFELRYHALTEQYVLLNLETQHRQSFTSLYSALTALGKVNDFILPPEYLVEAGDEVQLSLKTGLDLHALPTPMRPGAIISTKWQLDSEWVNAEWQ